MFCKLREPVIDLFFVNLRFMKNAGILPEAGFFCESSGRAVQTYFQVVDGLHTGQDTCVGYLGIMQKGGPRYTFEVPKGKSIAVEVARKGYGTRKVTLDGSQSKITIGLRKAKASDGS